MFINPACQTEQYRDVQSECSGQYSHTSMRQKERHDGKRKIVFMNDSEIKIDGGIKGGMDLKKIKDEIVE